VDTGAGGLNDGGVTEFALSEVQRDEVRAAVLQAAGVPLAELTPGSFPLPTAGAVFRRLAREVTGGAGFALLRGVPVDDDPDLIRAGVGCHAGRIVPLGAQQVPVQHVRDQGRIRGAGDAQLMSTVAYSAQFDEFCRVEACQHGDDAALGAIELGEDLAHARVDLAVVVLDVLADCVVKAGLPG
jgi:hypothetical protein